MILFFAVIFLLILFEKSKIGHGHAGAARLWFLFADTV